MLYIELIEIIKNVKKRKSQSYKKKSIKRQNIWSANSAFAYVVDFFCYIK